MLPVVTIFSVPLFWDFVYSIIGNSLALQVVGLIIAFIGVLIGFIGILIAILPINVREKIYKKYIEPYLSRRIHLSRERIIIISLIILVSALILIVIIVWPPPPSCLGRELGGASPVLMYPNYFDPSGKMGDIGDIEIKKGTDSVRFTYEARGRPPHEWDWKYVNCSLNSEPAQFGGVVYLYPANNYGNEPGWDLRPAKKTITWEARSVNSECNVEFFMGGINWNWSGCTKGKPSCPDSLPRESLGGITKLTTGWQKFSHDLTENEDKYFVNVIGGFGWVINWGSNDVHLNESRTGPVAPKTFIIEIRNIRIG